LTDTGTPASIHLATEFQVVDKEVKELDIMSIGPNAVKTTVEKRIEVKATVYEPASGQVHELILVDVPMDRLHTDDREPTPEEVRMLLAAGWDHVGNRPIPG
jgi:hypothetical protein